MFTETSQIMQITKCDVPSESETRKHYECSSLYGHRYTAAAAAAAAAVAGGCGELIGINSLVYSYLVGNMENVYVPVLSL